MRLRDCGQSGKLTEKLYTDAEMQKFFGGVSDSYPTSIRKGDKLEHGGEVTGGSPWFEAMGQQLARKGDETICEQHGPTTTDDGYGKFRDRKSKAIAFHHCRCACGCRLLSSLVNFNIE